MCKKFDQTTKWYIHKPEYVLENVTYKILWDFEIPTDYLIPARRLDLENLWNGGLCHPNRPRIENQKNQKER